MALPPCHCLVQVTKGAPGQFRNILRSYNIPRNPYRRGMLSTVDLLEPTRLVQVLLLLQTTFTFFTKQVTLMTRSTVFIVSVL